MAKLLIWVVINLPMSQFSDTCPITTLGPRNIMVV